MGRKRNKSKSWSTRNNGHIYGHFSQNEAKLVSAQDITDGIKVQIPFEDRSQKLSVLSNAKSFSIGVDNSLLLNREIVLHKMNSIGKIIKSNEGIGITLESEQLIKNIIEDKD